MTSKNSNSLKELKGLREAVIAEEQAKTHERLKRLPPGPSREQPAISMSPDMEPQDEFEEDSPLPSPPLSPLPPPAPRPQVSSANAARPAAASPSAPAVTRAKTVQESALIIPLTPKIQERLQKHVENGRWSQADLVIELIRAFLHGGYPEIHFGDQLIAKAGTYRTFERNPLETVLKIVSGQGVFNVTVSPENAEFQNWLSHFSNQKAADPQKAASQVCLFALQTFLESVEDFKVQGWVKSLPTDAYSVAPAG